MEEILRDEMRFLAIKTRDRLKLTQRQMAALLYMSESSYSDIETGRQGCGALTVVRLLALQDDCGEVIDALELRFRQAYEEGMAV